jgi:hypothetical protein
MFNLSQPQFDSSPRLGMPEWQPGPGRTPGPDEQFIAMLDAYRDHGGLARVQEVVARFRRCRGADVATLANWITRRQVICFEWQSQSWLPLFQFNRVDMEPQPELGQLFTELVAVYDHWELAGWFVRPHARLAHRTPVEALATDLAAVIGAARFDRLRARQ